MKILKSLLAVFSVTIVFACNGKQPAAPQDPVKPARTFTMVTVPAMISEPEQRIDYLVKHYWDTFDFRDTAYVGLPEVTEQAFSNYIAFLEQAAPETASASLNGMLAKAEADSTMYAYFTGLSEKYLYDPNSPMRNEELYIVVLKAVLASPLPDEVHKIRPAHLLELALKNKLGEKTTDFSFTQANGQTTRLFQLKADYLLLFFYNPDCEACKELTGQLSNAMSIQKLVRDKRMVIAAIYPDEDLQLWKDHLDHLPAEWIVGYDTAGTLKNDELYDLKAIPCLYLLDKEKKVLLKDVSFNQLMDYISLLN